MAIEIREMLVQARLDENQEAVRQDDYSCTELERLEKRILSQVKVLFEELMERQRER